MIPVREDSEVVMKFTRNYYYYIILQISLNWWLRPDTQFGDWTSMSWPINPYNISSTSHHLTIPYHYHLYTPRCAMVNPFQTSTNNGKTLKYVHQTYLNHQTFFITMVFNIYKLGLLSSTLSINSLQKKNEISWQSNSTKVGNMASAESTAFPWAFPKQKGMV